MALTEEQIKNLKPGTSLVIHGEYIRSHSEGDLVIKCNITRGAVPDTDIRYFHPSCVSLSLEKLKYDPYRLFRKGDIVRLKEWNGRCSKMYSGTDSWFDHPPRCKNGNLEVREDEKDSKVKIGIIGADCAHATAAPCYLELITPVEEIAPYYIEETEYEFCVTIMVGERKDTPAIYHKKMHPNAQAAAEAECARLNEEWRKNKNND